MPITIEYQPSLIAAGQLAYDAGRGQFLQDRDRFQLQSASLGEQARQFDQRLQFAAQESALRDRQFRDQLGMQGYQFNVQTAQRQQGMYADLMRQQMVQEGYAQHAQTQYDIALMREDARAAEQQMVMQRQQALSEQQALQKYIQDNRGVLTPQQVTDLQAQFEQRHGLPFGFDASAAIEAQRAVEETAMKRRAAVFAETHGISPDAAEDMLYFDPQRGVFDITDYGKVTIDRREKEMDNARLLEIATKNEALQREELEIRWREIDAKFQQDAAKEQETAQQDQEKAREQAYRDLDTKGRKSFADVQKSWEEWGAWNAMPEGMRRAQELSKGAPMPPPGPDLVSVPRMSVDQITSDLPPYTMFRTNFNGIDIVVIQLPNGKQAVWDGKVSPSALVRSEMAKGAK